MILGGRLHVVRGRKEETVVGNKPLVIPMAEHTQPGVGYSIPAGAFLLDEPLQQVFIGGRGKWGLSQCLTPVANHADSLLVFVVPPLVLVALFPVMPVQLFQQFDFHSESLFSRGFVIISLLYIISLILAASDGYIMSFC